MKKHKKEENMKEKLIAVLTAALFVVTFYFASYFDACVFAGI